MVRRVGVRWAARQLLRVLPLPWLLGAVTRVAPAYARRAIDSRWLPLPRGIGEFLEDFAELRGEPLTSDARRRLAGDRFAFILIRPVVNLVVETWPADQAHRRLPPIAVDGVHHLEAALARGRGAVLVTGHFGFPVLARMVMAARGIDVVAVGAKSRWVDELVGGDLWDRARLLHRLRAGLTGRRVCVFLPDGGEGDRIKVRILGSNGKVQLGAFILGRQARCPVLPVFAVRSPRTAGFAIEFGAPLSSMETAGGTEPADAAREFGRLLDSYARRFPDHLFGY
jgi:lauroyl/myristoyl acyltransferase